MRIFICISILGIIFTSCAKNEHQESTMLARAKWYFYSYTVRLKAYDSSGKDVESLNFNIRVSKVLQVGSDTQNVYIDAYKSDSSNVLFFKPYGLVGVKIIKDSLYLPIYHLVEFDKQNNEEIQQSMIQQDKMLLMEIEKRNDSINSWLITEAEIRKRILQKARN